MKNHFQEVADKLDVETATVRGSERNDLLPPRYEDKVGGELGKRFSEKLATILSRGRYEPSRAIHVFVPKPANTTRPAALMSLTDRVVFDSLVEELRPRIEVGLLGKQLLFWPRGEQKHSKRWLEFEMAPLLTKKSHVAMADIAGFYESIDHEFLRETLVNLTGRRDIVNALVDFLDRAMDARKGIPQGISASDPLATAYLSSVDSAMARECLEYYRHGDDIRIACSSMSEARRTLYIFEQQLRRVGLLVNASKSIAMKAETYAAALESTRDLMRSTRRALLAERFESLDEDEMGEAIAEAGKGQLSWDFFYHGTLTFAELVEELEPHVSLSESEVAARVFRDAMAQRPGNPDAIDREVFHQRITASLVRLAAARSPAAVDLAGQLVSQFPDKAEIVANYLLAVGADHSEAVVRQVFSALSSDSFRTAWEKAWLLRVWLRFSDAASSEHLKLAEKISQDENEPVFSRVEAIKVLAATGRCDHLLVKGLWNRESSSFHPDLLAAAFLARESESWCEAFIEGAKGDPINAVVLRHLTSDGKV